MDWAICARLFQHQPGHVLQWLQHTTSQIYHAPLRHANASGASSLGHNGTAGKALAFAGAVALKLTWNGATANLKGKGKIMVVSKGAWAQAPWTRQWFTVRDTTRTDSDQKNTFCARLGRLPEREEGRCPIQISSSQPPASPSRGWPAAKEVGEVSPWTPSV